MTPNEPSAPERFRPHAAREMSGMFDDVSGRYDLLNRLMTLGQDHAWRVAMWRRVPETARAVLDLCTGSGASLPGLRRPGRIVLGIDVSLGMLARAEDTYGGAGWAPRFVCADAFRLPLPDASLDAVTVAFGVRNLRPRREALAELARVLEPGGWLVVLEAVAPAQGPLAPLHRAWIRHVIPTLGRLSPDPTAYRYLSESILEFGAGPEFEHDLAKAGFRIADRASFMLGATRLWAARRGEGIGENPTEEPFGVQIARPGVEAPGQFPHTVGAGRAEGRAWTLLQAAVSGALAAALAWGGWSYLNLRSNLPLRGWQELLLEVLIGIGIVVFGVRALALLLVLASGRPGPRT